jgi:hypothetical protein
MSQKRIAIQSAGRPDNFMTPPAALGPLWPFIRPGWRIWEPAAGTGNLYHAFTARGYDCIAADILPPNEWRREQNFMTDWRDDFDCIITNPPFSIKDEFLRKCYQHGKPFALIMPLTGLEGRKRQALYRTHGLELLIFDRRINYETPSGKGSGSWFPSGWFSHGLDIGQSLTFWEFPKEQMREEKPGQLTLGFETEAA